MISTAAHKEIRDKYNEMRKSLSQLEKFLGKTSEREKDADRKHNQRAAERLVVVRQLTPEQKEWREFLELDDEEWMRWFFEDLFFNPFTGQQKAIIKALGLAIRYGGDQSIAASRGEGKTSLAEVLATKYVLTGQVRFGIIFAATGSKARDSLASIKDNLEGTGDAMGSIRAARLLEYYPEVCEPVRALKGVPQRASSQPCSGFRHDNDEPYEYHWNRFSWCGDEITFPNLPGSPSAGAVIATRGLDAEIRGVKKGSRRPELAIIDDPDTEDTVRSEEQAKKLELRIERSIAALGGQQRPVARVMLTTLQRRCGVSYDFTDTTRKPSWRGKRFRFLLAEPTRQDLWDEYMQQWKLDKSQKDEDGNPLDPHSRTAHQFYLDHRAEMDDGGEVANSERYDHTKLEDGSTLEVSAIQHYYNFVAKNGAESALSELDNDPPEETGPIESGINAGLVQRQLSGLTPGLIPEGCIALTHGVDVGKWALHWVVRAWKPDATGYTIDYGRQEVHGAQYGTDEGLDRAIQAAILRRMDEFNAASYAFEDGVEIGEPLTLIDASYRTDAVYSGCMAAGMGVYPVMGFGKSVFGGIRRMFSPAAKRSATTVPGDGWKLERKGHLWLVECDADRWKAWEHDRWMTAKDRPGCMWLYGEGSDDPNRLSADERFHVQYAHHICAEVEIEEIYQGALRRNWKAKSKENHWLDASYYSDVAASIKQIHLDGPVAGKVPKRIPGQQQKRDRMTLGEMARA